MRAALVRRDRVDLVDDDRSRGRQHAAARFGAEQDVERFRRGDEDVRRAAAHALRARLRAYRRCAPSVRISTSGRPCARKASRMPASGASRLSLDVVRQRLQRRDVDDLRLVRERPSSPCRTRSSIAARKPPASCPIRSAPRSARCRPALIAGQASRLRRRRRGGSCAQTKRRRRDGTTRTELFTETLWRSLPAHALRMRHEQTLILR